MGRCREFKHEEALNKAMILFWKKGYENTSLKELLKEMNILNGSFYNCFKNKKNLFLLALDQYANGYTQEVVNSFSSDKPFKTNIRFLFENSLVCENIDRPSGCFLVNCATSSLMDDSEIEESVRKMMDGFYLFVEEKLVEAQEKGEISSEIDAKSTTKLALSYLHGRMRMTKLFPHDQRSRDEVEFFLTSLGI